ncbi:beta-N-acetylhexosaminidase [Lipingzhangella sp. LS1_29]|uniref:beta-N-acetylhexosaminidase n=1 Tax=Lipingzhangella rawalii TaxID=2055835 RepID=A0ABU2H7M0_9ACTN|nr:beta-N-acetylhexosaminidase [Lipingzhangella rawalii]MDS1270977.1 beta-N-acetylhexosaminidase [Lipingzhangella rawalii]
MTTTAPVPHPRELTPGQGTLQLDITSTLDANSEAVATANWLRRELGAATGLPLTAPQSGDAPTIELTVDASLGEPSEGYRLTVTPDGVRILGTDPAGVFYGAQTLRQLLPASSFRQAPVHGTEKLELAAVDIADSPRFRWRGVMLDVARHFLPKREILRYIDLLAMHKLNVLHLHLTDDQGWRVEIQRYPKLTEVSSWRRESQVGASQPPTFDDRPHGGYYTQDDIREIVAYAAQRHITVVPEVDVPGHSQAAIAAYPELGSGATLEVATQWGIIPEVLNVSDATLDFYRGVFTELMDLFPSPYICVGGDECPKDQWRASPEAQERIRAEGLADEEELQSWFIRQLDDFLTAHGRRLLGWDEILQGGLAPGATVLSWRGTSGGIDAARAGHDVIMCPVETSYLDYRQSDDPQEPIPVGPRLSLEDVYTAETVPGELSAREAEHVLGGQVNIWSEHLDSARRVDYMAFPRVSAFAESVWMRGQRSYQEFLPRLTEHLRRLDALGVEYRPRSGPHPWQQRPGVAGRS